MKPRFISDLHLSENNPKLVEAFLKFLQESKQVCTHFYILGDLFEAWIGDDDDSLLSNKVKRALYEFTNDGPKTFFIHGNRDFLIGNSFAEDTGITILPDPYVLDINNQNVVISHGDFLCTDDKDYISFRNEVRSEEWQSNFLNKSLVERKEIASSMRDASQEATSEKSNAITDVSSLAVQDFVNEHTPDLLIHGHTHRPNIHKVSDSIRIVLGDWGDYGWFLSINDKDYKLEKFSIS